MRLFLACPLTRYLRNTPDGPRLDADFTALIVRIETALLAAGHDVFLAHRLEEFGSRLRTSEHCTPFDLLEMQRADAVVALPESSYGVHIELGWATALDKPIVLVRSGDAATASPLLDGLATVANVQTVTASETWTLSVNEQDAVAERIVQALRACRPRPRRPLWAFLATAFGFGPVSKAVAVAREVRAQAPSIETHFFGSGVDGEFAVRSRAFDRVFRIDVDSDDRLDELIPQLAQYQAVFSVMNMAMLPRWQGALPPLYLIDSLAWMWPGPPVGLGNVATYYVQDYLVPALRLRELAVHLPAQLVGPVIDVAHTGASNGMDHHPSNGRQRSIDEQILLVNFSGCANPFSDATLLREYVLTLGRLIMEEAGSRFDRIVFCCNDRLSAELRDALGGAADARHVPHAEFIDLLATATTVLTAPGITTTLEAMALNAPVRFLLPQNYSQTLISEHYRTLLGEGSCMALSRFGRDFTVDASLPEEEGVRRVARHLDLVLRERRDELRAMLREILERPAGDWVERLRTNMRESWARPGQHAIVSDVLRRLGTPAVPMEVP